MATKKTTKPKSIQKTREARPSRLAQAVVQTPKVHPIFGTTTPPPTKRSMPWFGWLGLGIMVMAELLLFRVPAVAVVFTAIMWTGYILFLDGWIWQRGGFSYFIDRKREWPMLFLISVLLWDMFEILNVKGQNWVYLDLAPNLGIREWTALWAFGTIIPALLRTWNFFGTLKILERSPEWRVKFTPFMLAFSFITGVAFIVLPVLMSETWAKILVPCTWVGFILLVEPVNYLLNKPGISMYRQLEQGNTRPLLQLLVAGLFCGFVWEGLNEQALHAGGQGWTYELADIWNRLGFYQTFGEMPLVGFGGYPFFIWENFVMYELIKYVMQGDKMWKSPTSNAHPGVMEQAA